jgi:hypothetical protein
LLLLAGAAAGTTLTVTLPVLSFFFLSLFHWSTPPQPPLPSLLLLVMAIWLANIYFSKAGRWSIGDILAAATYHLVCSLASHFQYICFRLLICFFYIFLCRPFCI